MVDRIHVVAAAILNDQGEVLIAKRADHLHQGGLWEFPGGKVENGEATRDALTRELHEEIGIDVVDARPLIRIKHDYTDKSVLLDVWKVTKFGGEAHGKEGQPIEWVKTGELDNYDFPAANTQIINALQLPSHYLITPAPGDDESEFLSGLEKSLQSGIKLMQLRAKGMEQTDYIPLAKKVIELAHRYGCQVLLNAAPELAVELSADGVHLDSRRLSLAVERPLPKPYLVAASGHNLSELKKAESIDASFALLSPVKYTKSHPDTEPLGWDNFAETVEQIALPVFALGGVSDVDEGDAFAYGGQGCAGIRGYWKG